MNKPNSNANIINCICGSKLSHISGSSPHNQNILIIHRDISRVNKSGGIPINDILIVKFIRFVQSTGFPDISTTQFIPLARDTKYYTLCSLSRAHVWRMRGPYLYYCAPRTQRNANEGLGSTFFEVYNSLHQ